jgi:hypothetical protein
MMPSASRSADDVFDHEQRCGRFARVRHRRRRRRRVARRDAHVDDRNAAGLDHRDRFGEHRLEPAHILDRAETARALRMCELCEVDVGIADALPDPLVLDRPVAHARDALLVHFVVVERAIVRHHDQQRNAVVRRVQSAVTPIGHRRRRCRPAASGTLSASAALP